MSFAATSSARMDRTTAWVRRSFSSFATASDLLNVSTPKITLAIDGATLTSACPVTEMVRVGGAWETARVGNEKTSAQVAAMTREFMVVAPTKRLWTDDCYRGAIRLCVEAATETSWRHRRRYAAGPTPITALHARVRWLW